jgi:hypothetical protein
MGDSNSLIVDGLALPVTAIAYSVSCQLAATFPDRAMIEGDSCSFDLRDFVENGNCAAKPKSEAIYNEIATAWDRPGRPLQRSLENIWFEVTWQAHTLDVLLMRWPIGYTTESRYWILADEVAVAEGFYAAVCEWTAEVRGEVLVYEGGGWHKSGDLFAAIQGSSFENLVLKGTLKEEISEDVGRFLRSREQYERYGVPWKRGILFIGPPGNGKTHCVKAIINTSRLPCLYVKSFKSEHSTDQDNIRSVFYRARRTTPCVLVLEDLDSLIDEENRAFFLNELDGFASNAGIVTLATTNHPERLDPSIVDRPSRFDRKYHFELPGPDERRAYVSLWNRSLQPGLRLSEAGVAEVADGTEEFSFAYLKELFLSSIMQWINAQADVQEAESGMDAVMKAQVDALREQMATMTEETVGAEMLTDDAVGRSAAMMMRRYRAMFGRRR